MHLRYLIVQICLDIEHFLKVSLLSHIENNPLEDGYELISFGDLTYLCEFYNQLYKEQIVNNRFMNTVRDIRNASAHSNCLINKLFEPKTQQTDILISNFVQNIPTINKHSRIKNLNYRIVYNFVTLLYIYDSTIPNGIAKQKRYNELKKLLTIWLVKHTIVNRIENRILFCIGW